MAEIEAQGWSLTPGRYVGTRSGVEDGGNFAEALAELHDEFTVLSDEAEMLRGQVDAAVQGILEP
jgi:type I restriction enzyme M protein